MEWPIICKTLYLHEKENHIFLIIDTISLKHEIVIHLGGVLLRMEGDRPIQAQLI